MPPLRSIESDRLPEADADRQRHLFERMQRGDGAAFGWLLRCWWRPLVLYAARIVGTLDSAEDIVQEAFVRFWERRAAWRPASTPRILLYTITRNLALNDRKYGAGRARLLRQRALPFEKTPATPVQTLEAAEFQAALERALARLPAKRREVLLLSRYDGLSRAEIAELTGLSQQTVANYLTLAIADLRVRLRAFLEEPS